MFKRHCIDKDKRGHPFLVMSRQENRCCRNTTRESLSKVCALSVCIKGSKFCKEWSLHKKCLEVSSLPVIPRRLSPLPLNCLLSSFLDQICLTFIISSESRPALISLEEMKRETQGKTMNVSERENVCLEVCLFQAKA